MGESKANAQILITKSWPSSSIILITTRYNKCQVSIHILNQYLFNDIVIRSPLKDQMPLQPSPRLASKSNGISFFSSGPRNAFSEFLPGWATVRRNLSQIMVVACRCFFTILNKKNLGTAHTGSSCEPLSKSIVYTCCKKASYRFCGGPIALQSFVQINTW